MKKCFSKAAAIRCCAHTTLAVVKCDNLMVLSKPHRAFTIGREQKVNFRFQCWVHCASKYNTRSDQAEFVNACYKASNYCTYCIRLVHVEYSMASLGNMLSKEICILSIYFAFSQVLWFSRCYAFLIWSIGKCSSGPYGTVKPG